MSFVTSFFDFPEREKKNATSNPFLTTETIFLLFNFQKKKEKRNLNGNVVLVFFVSSYCFIAVTVQEKVVAFRVRPLTGLAPPH